MTLLQAVILGIVQGLTEFLPVSSSGHLLLLQGIFGIKQDNILFEVILHLGTLIPVLIIYWKDIAGLIRHPFQKLTYLLIIGTLPAVLATLFLGDYVDAVFAGTQFLAVGFIITGCLLLYADRAKTTDKTEKDMTYADAAIVGIVQAVAITPGISRSGSTMSASLFRKMDREAAAKFAFLMSIPAILGAAVLQVKDIITGDIIIAELNLLNIGAGFIAAMLSGYLAINFMITLIKKCKLKYFAIYVFLLAAFLIIEKFFLGGSILG